MKKVNENFHFNFESNEKTTTLILKRKQNRTSKDSEVSFLAIFFKSRSRKNLRKIRNEWKLCKLKKRLKTMQNLSRKCTGQKCLKLKSKKLIQSDSLWQQSTLERTQSNSKTNRWRSVLLIIDLTLTFVTKIQTTLILENQFRGTQPLMINSQTDLKRLTGK